MSEAKGRALRAVGTACAKAMLGALKGGQCVRQQHFSFQWERGGPLHPADLLGGRMAQGSAQSIMFALN